MPADFFNFLSMIAYLKIRIENLRLPLCLLVIAIHSASNSYVGIEGLFVHFLSKTFPMFAVPCFFFISAYITGLKYKKMTGGEYITLLKKRLVTIFLPYAIWCLLAFFMREAVNFSPLSRYTSGHYHFTSVTSLLNYLFLSPCLEPLWFLRNLLLFSVMLPIFYTLRRTLKALSILIFIALEFICGVSYLAGMFYFFAGIYVAQSVSEETLDRILSRAKLCTPLYLVICISSFFVADSFASEILLFIACNIGIIGAFTIVSSRQISTRRIASASTIFFAYAFHGIISPYVIKLSAMIIPILSPLMHFFLNWAAITFICFALYALLSAYLPRLASLLTGGRINRSITPL